ncbi:type II toxin-antitoxin system VapC family toxin, partial [Mucilaginibacter sp.]|uniref:type II toxin-antitoxin system VapC family toxin n=1 Tax=Mucilaginibacter sp. TaxID=1882438 RepID=UPI002624F014
KLNTTLYLLPDNEELYISSVTLYELYMGATTKEKEDDVRALTDDLTVLPFTDTIAFKAAQLYHQLKQKNKMIEFRDIFIAATCIVNEIPLITLNKKHFKRMEEIHLL